ncbi:uncharacterized protein METZ01_LOCUS140421 [marine metagenome]|uniref:Uncharacterized protein n=1 Tax=marine metagenome TaxID=408172 RepID=A0A381ZFP2_9ZZZZ
MKFTTAPEVTFRMVSESPVGSLNHPGWNSAITFN